MSVSAEYALASLTLSAPSNPIPNTTALSPYTLKVISEARKRITYHKTHNPHLVSQVDDSILIIEDETGGLIHCEGDLSFLAPSTPKCTRSSRIN